MKPVRGTGLAELPGPAGAPPLGGGSGCLEEVAETASSESWSLLDVEGAGGVPWCSAGGLARVSVAAGGPLGRLEVVGVAGPEEWLDLTDGFWWSCSRRSRRRRVVAYERKTQLGTRGRGLAEEWT
jgi:hypothetical protein